MKLFVLAILLLFIISDTKAQQHFVAWKETNPLRWEDFSGKANDTSHFEAESFAEVVYSYRFNNLYDFDFDVKAIFNRNTSWIKKDYKSEALLKHEQVHFDIAELFARKLKLAFYNHVYSGNFQAEILQIFNTVKSEYHQVQQQYDDNTNHSLVTAKQKEWETRIKDELARMKQNNIVTAKERLFVTNK
ncbi:MAG TPA: DUF922 domain-containing protein [Segetibacter sp.]|jgi:hypothetical protein